MGEAHKQQLVELREELELTMLRESAHRLSLVSEEHFAKVQQQQMEIQKLRSDKATLDEQLKSAQEVSESAASSAP